jgi:hypothetical protein
MKRPGKLFNGRLRLAGVAIVAFACLKLSWQANAQIYTLTDGNSVAKISPENQAGMFYWALQGQNQLGQQWFWLGIGNNAQQSIDTISAPVVTTIGNNQLTSTYTSQGYSVSISYLLTGGAVVGAGQTANSDIGESIRIMNTSSASTVFHFFQYSDFDLGGPSNDTVTLGKNLRGQFNDAYQTDPNAGLTETVTTPGANHGEAAFFNTTLAKLNGPYFGNLSDTVGPVGPGDVTWAFQWDFNIAPGGSALISKDKYLSVTIVPEPATLGLVALGLVAFALRRSRQAA